MIVLFFSSPVITSALIVPITFSICFNVSVLPFDKAVPEASVAELLSVSKSTVTPNAKSEKSAVSEPVPPSIISASVPPLIVSFPEPVMISFISPSP